MTKTVEKGSDQLLAEAGHIVSEPSTATTLKRPDITPAQIVGAIPVVATLLHAFGVFTLSGPEQDALSNAVNYALGLVGADAVIRLGRSLGQR